MSDNIFICKECQEQFDSKFKFGAHIRAKHNITAQLYWDKWYGKHICECGKETKFLGISAGYQKFCCSKCACSSKESIEKRKKTNLEKYGVEFAQACTEVKEKAKQTCQERYGSDSYICTLTKEEQSNNGKKSWSESVRKEREETCLTKYGVKHISEDYFIKEKRKNTMKIKYGVEHALQNYDIQKKSKKHYTYNDLTFDSSWELAYYIWLTDNKINFVYHPETFFNYSVDNEIHRYFPDFIVDNEYIEIKGEQFFKENNMVYPYIKNNMKYTKLLESKYECMKQNNVKILRINELRNVLYYVQKTYGKDYLNSFRNK